ncbi:MAG: phosphoribosylglycinamide formyltransferase [SAR324 cluster bacterium]|nr:phosphoribosylglycinamide formyltransferase [SAR324 cluster bacterium]
MSTPPLPMRLGFLASHGGSNLQAILDAIQARRLPAQAMLVICNNSSAMALKRAQAAGVEGLHLSVQTHPEPEALDGAILAALRAREVNLVVLAGYMKKIGPQVLGAYARRVLNIHPALLPKFGGQGMYGMRVHEAVLAAGETVSGASVHLVDGEYDRGPVLARKEVPILPQDTAQQLQARVLEQEHLLYPETLRGIAAGEIDLDRAG